MRIYVRSLRGEQGPGVHRTVAMPTMSKTSRDQRKRIARDCTLPLIIRQSHKANPKSNTTGVDGYLALHEDRLSV